MVGCREVYVWSHHSVVSDVDMCIIHTGQPEVSINIITKMNMPSAPVCIKRWLDITAFSCFCEHFFDQLCSFFHLGWAGLIVVVHFFQAGHLETHKFFDVWIEKIPAYKA